MRSVRPRRTHVVMTQASPIPVASHTSPASWSIAGLLLEAIAARDFTKMVRCFEPEATLRALLPSGPAAFHSAAEVDAHVPRSFG